MPTLYELLGVSTPFDPTHKFSTSWAFPTWLFAAIRLLFSLYAFVTQFVILGLDTPQDDRASFSYFTILTYWGLAFYFLFAGRHSASCARNGRAWLEEWPRPLQALHSLFYSTICVYPIIVTIVFWVLLYKPPFFPVLFDRWSNISRHGLNSLFCLFEIIFARAPSLPWLHLPLLIVIIAMYLGLAYLTRATEGFYVYAFLDPAQGPAKTAGYILGILAALIVVFLIVKGLIWLRSRITDGSASSSRKRGAKDVENMEMQSANF